MTSTKPAPVMAILETDPTIPLLPKNLDTSQSQPPLNSLQRFAIAFFSCIRLIRGLCFIAWPALGLSSFDIPQSGATFLLGSLLGSRDLLLGGLLWTADIKSAREVRRALLVNLLSDAMDTFILIFSAACMWHWRNPFVEIGAAALMAILEHLTLWSMDEEDGTRDAATRVYAAALQAGEDKQKRMDMWFSDMRMVEAQKLQGTASTQHAESIAE